MPRPDRQATREQLLRAGARVIRRRGLAALRVDDVVAAAGVAKGTFYLHFADRAGFLVDLHRRFHEEILVAVLRAVQGQPAGAARLLDGSLAYLDACRRQQAIKALLVEARAEPAIQREVATQNARFGERAALDFEAAAWTAPAAAARLWVGLVAEGALAEAEARAALPALRAQLARFLGVTAAA